jgi:hypothetical protein
MGLVVGVTMHLLMHQLQSREPEIALGNMPTAANTPQSKHQPTPLGPLMGITVFALCCVLPGSPPKP